MRRVVVLACILLFEINTFAKPTEVNIAENSIQNSLLKIKKILNSREWSPADTVIERQLLSLISLMENPPADSVVEVLDKIVDNKEILIARDYQKIKDPETIKGYVPQREISRKLKEISDSISAYYNTLEIELPKEFADSNLASLPLISEEEIGRMVIDSLYTFPDSIMDIINDPATDDNRELRSWLDSVCFKMLEEARISYNDSLLAAHNDSLTQQYRDAYIQTLICREQNAWLDSVYKVNNQILARYNDSETLRMNRELKQELQIVLEYMRNLPNKLSIVNLNNERSDFLLRNNGNLYQWIYLKNSQNDSIGIRIESIDKHSVKMLVDETVNLSRLTIKDGLEVDKITSSQLSEITLSKFTTRNPILSPWKLIGKAYAGFTQTYINPYWSQGGKSSASALATFNYAANYKKNKIIWENFVDMKVGVIYYLPEDGVVAHRNWHKNSDNFELNSRFGLSAAKKWYYSAEANFKTQSFYGFKNQNDTVPSSAFLAPAYLTFSAGMEYKPSKDFSAFLSPLSLKTTYVINPLVDETKFGLTKGQTHRSRIGISGKVDYSKNIIENVSLKTKNSVFINMGNNSAGEWQLLKLPDFDSETSIDFKVNQFISTQVNFHLIYDKDVESTWASSSGEKLTGTRLQVKEFFTLGISYKF